MWKLIYLGFYGFLPWYKSGFEVCIMCLEFILDLYRLRYVLEHIGGFGTIWSIKGTEIENIILKLHFWTGFRSTLA